MLTDQRPIRRRRRAATAGAEEQRLRAGFGRASREQDWQDFAGGCGEELWLAFWQGGVGSFAHLLGCWLDAFGSRRDPARELGIDAGLLDVLKSRLGLIGIDVPGDWN